MKNKIEELKSRIKYASKSEIILNIIILILIIILIVSIVVAIICRNNNSNGVKTWHVFFIGGKTYMFYY